MRMVGWPPRDSSKHPEESRGLAFQHVGSKEHLAGDWWWLEEVALFAEPSQSGCSRVPSPCSCSFCFFFSSLRSLTLRSLALPMPPAWRMDSNRVARPLEGSTTSLGASWTWKKGCSGRVRLWDSPAQCKVLGILRSCQQPGCEQGLSMKRKPAGEAGPLVKPGC